MFAYCLNNPVIFRDSEGASAICVTNGDRNPLLIGHIGLGGGGGGCGGGYIENKSSAGKQTSQGLGVFGAGVIQSNAYNAFTIDALLGGIESGLSTSSTILGDVGKPISVFAQNASDWWKLTEYKVGAQINVGGGGLSFAYGVGESSFSFSFGDGTSAEVLSGVNKFGITISRGADFGAHTAESYLHAYIRSIPATGILLVLSFNPQIITQLPALIPGLS